VRRAPAPLAPGLLFLSAHHRHSHEMALRCQQAGVRLLLPPADTREWLRHTVDETLVSWMDVPAPWVEQYPDRAALERGVAAGEVDAVLVSVPGQIEIVRRELGALPVGADHMLNAFDEFRAAGLSGFHSPSRAALLRVGAPNSLLGVKLRDFERIDRLVRKYGRPARERRGFFAYIHHYARRWPEPFALFEELARRCAPEAELRHFGQESPHGEVRDLPSMLASRATLHLKDGQVCCNAVIDSICVGRPVLIDERSWTRLGLEDYVVHGVSGLVFRGADEGVDWIRRLQRDDALLDELSARTYAFARLKCRHTAADVARFRAFVEALS
jgi:hypothetical protein